jgi:hypothetical protein
MWRVRVTIVAMEKQQSFLFVVGGGVDVAVSNIQVFSVAMYMHCCRANKIYRTAVNNNKY